MGPGCAAVSDSLASAVVARHSPRVVTLMSVPPSSLAEGRYRPTVDPKRECQEWRSNTLSHQKWLTFLADSLRRARRCTAVPSTLDCPLVEVALAYTVYYYPSFHKTTTRSCPARVSRR